ncbi:MAG: SpoIID/LytB domain-containing protein [Ignavibacteria bacterium]
MQEPHIHVGILYSPKIEFRLKGEYLINNSLSLRGEFSAELTDGKIVLKNNRFQKEFDNELIFDSLDSGTSFILKNVVIGINFHWERNEDQEFKGNLKIIIEDDKLAAINIIHLEEYLSSVISSEMSANSNSELLKAHAIISRSWLLAQIQQDKNNIEDKNSEQIISENEIIKWYNREDHKNFDVCSDDHCQRYQGIAKIQNENAIEAVLDTRGIVLYYEDSVCDARYSKCCGGVSESFQNVWEPKEIPYLQSIYDYKYQPDIDTINLKDSDVFSNWLETDLPAFCNTSDENILKQVLQDFDLETQDFYRWKVEYSQEEIGSFINTKTGFDFGLIKDLIPVERGESGRIIKLKIVGTQKEMIIGKELEIRRVLAEKHLYSSAFIVDKLDVKNEIPQRFKITGAGWGHGVGLCQIGAAVMSEIGYRFDEILMHYFKSASLKRIYQ